MSKHPEWLRTVADRAAKEGFSHWSNTCDMAANHLEELQEERTALRARLAQCAEFVKWVLAEGPWSGCDLDGGSVQDKAEDLGLIVTVKYDPEIHGEHYCAEPGDDWFVFSDDLKEER